MKKPNIKIPKIKTTNRSEFIPASEQYLREMVIRDVPFIRNAREAFLRFLLLPSLITETLFRKDFGERYYSYVSVLIVSGIIALLINITPILSSGYAIVDITRPPVRVQNDHPGKKPGLALVNLLVIVGTIHFIRLRHEAAKGIDLTKFSLYDGTPLPFIWDPINQWLEKTPISLDEYTIKRYGEPALAVLLGLLVAGIFGLYLDIVGYILITGGVASYTKTAIEFYKGRLHILKLNDKKILAQHIGKGLKPETKPSENHGISLPFMPPKNTAQREELYKAITGKPWPDEALNGKD